MFLVYAGERSADRAKRALPGRLRLPCSWTISMCRFLSKYAVPANFVEKADSWRHHEFKRHATLLLGRSFSREMLGRGL
ncbi:hypothetical protein C8039_12845 [Halogeometricum sp. wsp3]|nr:hypothetical protein C8039_12845 [Halogeometricum sp. wsp3]